MNRECFPLAASDRAVWPQQWLARDRHHTHRPAERDRDFTVGSRPDRDRGGWPIQAVFMASVGAAPTKRTRS